MDQCKPESLRPAGASLARSENAAYFQSVVTEFGFEQRSALLLGASEEGVGMPYSQLRRIAGGADVLVNISGTLTDEALTARIPVRLYLDLDPAFTQLWQDEGIDMHFDGHTHFATVGQAIGTPASSVPGCGRRWIGVLPPVALDHWPAAGEVVRDAFTTVGHWRGYGSVERDGVHYGQRAHSLRGLMSLPRLTEAEFQLALAVHPGEEKDLAALAGNGWNLLDPAEVAATPSSYRDFVQGSKAELCVAKSGYVVSHSGWFSDRSVCYLASGRPVVAQDTGFSDFLPTGEGLFAFETAEDVLAAIEELERDYDRHSRAARSLAEDLFDSDKVLAGLLERIRTE